MTELHLKFVLPVMIMLAAGLACFSSFSRHFFSKIEEAALRFSKDRKCRWFFAILLFLVLLLTAVFVLADFPNSADEYAYVFHAKTLSEGRLWNPLPEAYDFFFIEHIAQKDGRWVSRFPPGWPLLLAGCMAIKVPPATLNPVLGILALMVLYRITLKIHGETAAFLTAIGTALSAFYIFNSASYFSHALSLVLILASLLLAIRYCEKPGLLTALLIGVLTGWSFTARYLTAIVGFAPVGIYILKNSKKPWLACGMIFLGGVPFLAGLLYYNASITGNPFLMPTTWMGAVEKLGFSESYSVQDAFVNTIKRLRDLLHWTAPSVPLLYGVYVLAKFRKFDFHAFELIFPGLVFGYLFYFSIGGHQYGPRYYYEGFPIVFMSVSAWVWNICRQNQNWTVRFVVWFYFVGILLSAATLPLQAIETRHIIKERMDPFIQAEARGLKNAIVLIKTNKVGSRGPMRREDLIRNGLRLDQEVLFALYKENHEELKAHFPERKLYIYSWDHDARKGILEPLSV